MRTAITGAIVIFAAFASPAHAEATKVLQGARPKWALMRPEFLSAEPPKEAIVQIRFLDNQIRVSKRGQESFISQRFKFLRPEALQAANLRFIWNPSGGQLTVHSILLHRKDGSTTEMLGKAEFQIVQREENLEQSVLTGLTTAVFATPGVEVGDELEFSATIANRDPTLGDKPFGALQLPLIEIGGTYRSRVISSDGIALKRTVTKDIDNPTFIGTNNAEELLIRLDNPKSLNLPEGSPGRYNVGRLIEYSSFASWSDVSSVFGKLFDTASKLNPKSTVHAEIAKIAASTKDPEARALAALRFVQDRVRYVFVGFGTGNFTPATADQTWDRRYGDCKGKTALLLAVLRELDISAEAALVNSSGVDGITDRIPSPAPFNHVLVRAKIGDKQYWLDGTQFNSPKFENLPQPTFRTALPLHVKGAEIEAVSATPLTFPALLELVDIDASAGIDKPARIAVRKVLHGSEVGQLRAALASLAGEDLKRGLRSLLRYDAGTIEGEDTSWSYDEATGELNLNWSGTQKLDWEPADPPYKIFYLPGAGLTPPNELTRPKEQNQTAPWAVSFPDFSCWVTTMRMPPDQPTLRWTYSSGRVNKVVGGIQYFRQATLNKGVVQTVMSTRSLQAELSASEAKAIEAALPTFDASKSFVGQTRVRADINGFDDSRPIIESAMINRVLAAKLCQPSPEK
jgi:Domain of Unknown Function with PDB structure (DUF3857)/Transglutaminase-like superfamily